MIELEKLPFFEEGFKGKVLPVGKMSCNLCYETSGNKNMYSMGSIYYLYDDKLYSIDTKELFYSTDEEVPVGRKQREVKYFEIDTNDIGDNYFTKNKKVDKGYVYFTIKQYEEITAESADWNMNKTWLRFENEDWEGILFSEDGEWDFEIWYDVNCGDELEFQEECTAEELADRINFLLKRQ